MKKLLFGLVLALCAVSLSGCIIETYPPEHYHYVYRYDEYDRRVYYRIWCNDPCHHYHRY